MNIFDVIKKKIFAKLGIVKENALQNDSDRLTFINNEKAIVRQRLKEYTTWYYGNADELLNYYTGVNLIRANVEPLYYRNQRGYFWATSSTESDIKRTHSGQPRNIVDTLVSITSFPLIESGNMLDDESVVNQNLQKIIKESGLEDIYMNEQMPMTLVEGWGCYKINWNKAISDYPYAVFYRAEDVDFIKSGGRIIGVIFRDYYTNGKKKYCLIETRSMKYDSEKDERSLVIEKELYEMISDEEGKKITNFGAVPELADVEKYIEIGPVNLLFAVPTVFFKNTSNVGEYGRSIFTGKIELFDDLDQALSQGANAVRRSTPIEYFDSEFLERDRKTGMPMKPKSFDRKYAIYKGTRNADGGTDSGPVTVTQPNVDFSIYSNEAVAILLQIMNGLMSPATIGIDIAKKDNAEAQREKEKMTIFTRTNLAKKETNILKNLCSQLLVAYEFMTTGKITVEEYDISVKYSEFADDSYENKIEKLGNAYDSELISDEMYMDKLYGNSLSRAEYKKELNWLKENHTKPKIDGLKGIAGGGVNLPGMFNDDDEDI